MKRYQTLTVDGIIGILHAEEQPDNPAWCTLTEPDIFTTICSRTGEECGDCEDCLRAWLEEDVCDDDEKLYSGLLTEDD